jgi:uncharacterized integral membrane protein
MGVAWLGDDVPCEPTVEDKMDSSEVLIGQAGSAESVERHGRAVDGADATAGAAAGAVAAAETRGAHFARRAHRARLYLYAGAALVLLVFLIALALANTLQVKVNWVFGASSVSLVWLVLFAAILGSLLGMATGALFHWRTRRPRS